MMTTILILASVALAAVPFAARSVKRASAYMLAGSTLLFGIALVVAVPPLLGATPVASGLGFWYVDAFSGLLVLLIGLMQWTAVLTSGSYLGKEEEQGVVTLASARRYYALLALFVGAMFATVIADNLGVLWIALEATTLATTFLVAFYARPTSLEAAWKYLILCSTGIALGLVSVLVVYTAASGAGSFVGLDALRVTLLLHADPALSGVMLKVAFAFALVGYGTKVGLVPLHTWLPDAHSSAPAPISALLSGVLLNAAFLALIRYKTLADAALGGSSFTDGLMLVMGALTVLVAALFIVAQTDYKRLLAYSSIEHMGFVVFTAALGAAGAIASIIEVIGHALTKSMLFFGAGNILLRFHSTKLAKVANVYRTLPITGGLFLVGVLFLLAAPPSPLFMSEYLGIAAGIVLHPFLTGIVLIAFAVALAGFIRLVIPMLFARTSAEPSDHEIIEGESLTSATAAMLVHAVLLIGFFAFLVSGKAVPVIERIASLIT